MATTGNVNTSLIKIFIGSGAGTAVTCLLNASFSGNMQLRDTTCKDSGSWTNGLPGRKGWEIGGSANFAYDAANGWAALWTAWTNGDEVRALWGTSVTGDIKYGGQGYITSLEGSADGNDENTEFSFTITGVGAPITVTNS